MDSSFYYCFLLFIFLYLLSKYFLQVFKNLPPSPAVSLPIIGHLYLFKKPLHRTLAKLSNQYGPILFMRFGSRPVIIVSSPCAVEECFTKNDIIFANRPRLLAGKHLGFNYTSLVWSSYGDHWRNLRRIASLEILSSNRLQMLYGIRLDEVRLLCQRLFQQGSKGGGTGGGGGDDDDDEYQIVDMKSIFLELTLNVMMRMIGGKRYYGEDVSGLEEARTFKDIVTETLQLSGATTNIADFLPFLKWVGLNKVEKKLLILQRKRDKFLQDLIEEHKRMKNKSDDSASEKRSNTMIDVLLSLQETDPEYYTDLIITGMIQVMLAAGSDTSAGTMEWALSNLLNNPEKLVKAQLEIDTNVGQSRLIEESDLGKLQYLNGIIKETLRMHPAAPLLVPHESSEECSIGGYKVPGGTMLLANLWAIQNDPEIWKEPSTFKPERFLEMERERDDNKYMLLPFGIGRRGCPGEGLAMRMVGLALGSLIQCFDWGRTGGEMVDMSEGSGLTVPRAQPFLLAMCRPRPALVSLLSQL